MTDRRHLLGGAGALTCLAALGGAAWRPAVAQDGGPPDRIATATFAAGIELASVLVYQTIATRGLLDPDTVGLVLAFANHHAEHAGTFNGMLDAAGYPMVAAPDPAIVAQHVAFAQQAPDGPTLLSIAWTLEQSLAATHIESMELLDQIDDSLVLARIAPVESQHAVVLATALNSAIDDRLPAFEPTDAALEPDDA